MEDTSCFTIAREIPHMSWGLRRQRTAATANVPSVVGCALADPGLNERDLCLGQLSPGLGHDAPGAHVHTCQLVDQIAGLRRGGSDVLAAAADAGLAGRAGLAAAAAVERIGRGVDTAAATGGQPRRAATGSGGAGAPRRTDLAAAAAVERIGGAAGANAPAQGGPGPAAA